MADYTFLRLYFTGIGKDIKSMTPALHDKISQFFVDLYGDYAGWAHTVLFAADLRRFSDKADGSKLKNPKPNPASQGKAVSAKRVKKAEVKPKLKVIPASTSVSSRTRGRKNP